MDGDCVVAAAARGDGRRGNRRQDRARVSSRKGNTSKKGTVLAKLEDDDLRTQMAVTLQELGKWQSESEPLPVHRRRRAAQGGGDRTAGFAGQARPAALSRRPAPNCARRSAGSCSRKIWPTGVGEALEIGKPFCEIGGRDHYEVRGGPEPAGPRRRCWTRCKQRAQLPVDFILHAHTGTRSAHGGRRARAPSARPPGRQSGRQLSSTVRADFPVDSALAATLKPGYTGKAKIDLGRHPLAAVMMRKFFDYWRVEWSL